MGSVYLAPAPNSSGLPHFQQNFIIRVFHRSVALLVFFSVLAAITGSILLLTVSHGSKKAQAGFDPVQWVICHLPKPIPNFYQLAETSDLQFYLFSQSAITAGESQVDQGAMNGMLDWIHAAQNKNSTFATRDQTVLGTSLSGTALSNPGSFNGGKIRYNPFDLYGVGGLQWSAYAGEWNHLFVDACNDNSDDGSNDAAPDPADATTTFAGVNLEANLGSPYAAPATRQPQAVAALSGGKDSIAALQGVDPTAASAIQAATATVEWQCTGCDGSHNPVIYNTADNLWTSVPVTKVTPAKSVNPTFVDLGAGKSLTLVELTNKAGNQIWVGSTELTATSGKSGDSTRNGQLNAINRAIAPLVKGKVPVVILGDFHTTGDKLTKPFGSTLTPLSTSAGTEQMLSTTDLSLTNGSATALQGKITSDKALFGDINISSGSTGGAGSGFASEAQDHNINLYYNNRLPPKSTWDDIDSSKDPRTIQFSHGLGSNFVAAIQTNVANLIFDITKFLVVITIVAIGLSFADVSKLIGLSTIITGKSGSDGLYQSLHENLFLPLITLAILGTAIYLIWVGIVKRQYRTAWQALARSVALFMFAIIVAAMPGTFITLPNDVAVVGEAFVATALNTNINEGSGICTSDAGKEVYVVKPGSKVTNPKDTVGLNKLIASASLNLQSAVGCNLWYNLLLRPFVQGQFGSDYSSLDNSKILPKEKNDQWVNAGQGDYHAPEVPIGNKKYLSNWALLDISVNTNAHAPYDAPGSLSKYNQGVANDWWRIADAFSGYQEAAPPPGSGISRGAPCPTTCQPLSQWNEWIGADMGTRIGVAFSSLLTAIISIIAPLFFAFLSAMFAIGIAILMALAPIFLLLGCWAGRGYEIFKSWAALVVNTTMKRVGAGLLCILSVTFVSTFLQKMNTIGYWKSVLLILILAIALIKVRKRIFSALSFARFANHDMGGTATKLVDRMRKTGATTGKFASSTAIGAVGSKRYGGSYGGGALAGFKREFENLSYRSPTIRAGMESYRQNGGNIPDLNGERCVACGGILTKSDDNERRTDRYGWSEAAGGYIHEECARDQNYNDVMSFTTPREATSGVETPIDSNSVYRDGELRKLRQQDLRNSQTLTPDNRDAKLTALAELIAATAEEIEKFKYNTQVYENRSNKNKEKEMPLPNVPQEIAPYVDQAAIALAWHSGKFEYIRLAYAAAWMEYAQSSDISPDNGESFTLSSEEIDELLQVAQEATGESWRARVTHTGNSALPTDRTGNQ